MAIQLEPPVVNIPSSLDTELLQATIHLLMTTYVHCTACAPHLVLVVDVGSCVEKLSNYLSVSILSSYSQGRKVPILQCSKHRDGRVMCNQCMQCTYFAQCTINSARGTHSSEHTSPLTVVTLLGSVPLLSRMSTISVWPLKLATHNGL